MMIKVHLTVFKRIVLLSTLSTVLAACDSNSVVVTSDGPDGATAIAEPVVVPQVSTEVAAAVCVDTPPVGDGWGWDGTQSCRIGDVTAEVSTDAVTVADNASSEDTRINLLGLIKLEPDSSEFDFSRALFGRLSQSLTSEEIQSFYAPTIDTCQVTELNANTGNDPQLNVFEQRLDLISAGETVVLDSAAGTFATLTSVQGANGPVYQTNVALNVERPTGISVNVIGEEFPEFSNVAFGDVPPLQVTNPPAGQNIDAFNFFEWEPNTVSLSVVEIYTGGFGANNQQILVGCTVVDDGNFSFPQSVRTQMGDDFDDDFTVYLRVVYNISRNGDALLITANSILADR